MTEKYKIRLYNQRYHKIDNMFPIEIIKMMFIFEKKQIYIK